MKRLLPCLLWLALCAGCAKQNYQYALVCDFPNFGDRKSWLVVSNDAGSILKIFGLPAGSSRFFEKFDYEAKDAADTYNLHLVQIDTANSLSMVFSCYGVQNGSAVSFYPDLIYPSFSISPYSTHWLYIRGIEGMDSVSIPGAFIINDYRLNYDASTQTASIQFVSEDVADLAIRVRTQPFAPFRSLYLPPPTSDSLEAQWAHFSPDSHFVTAAPPGNGEADYLQISAVAPDFKRFVILADYDSASQKGVPMPNRAPLLNGLSPESLFRVYMRQGNFITEKMFPPGEILYLRAPEISIKAALFSPFHTLQIATGGSPDLVEAYGYTYGPLSTTFPRPTPSFQWNIQGPPASFVKLQLPDLTELLPVLRALGPQPVLWQVTAYEYDYLDFDQLLAGFPYKGDDGRLFPVARAGLQKVTKNY